MKHVGMSYKHNMLNLAGEMAFYSYVCHWTLYLQTVKKGSMFHEHENAYFVVNDLLGAYFIFIMVWLLNEFIFSNFMHLSLLIHEF